MKLNTIDIKPYGDTAAVVSFGNSIDVATHQKVRALYEALSLFGKYGITGLIPAYASITIVYESRQIDFLQLEILVKSVMQDLFLERLPTYKIEIPVCYDSDFALDQKLYSEYVDMKWDDVIEIHSNKDYLIYFLGFVPGFPYLGGLDERLCMPRKDTPRLKVEVGSVGIASNQTGVYPIEIPGGWQIIGKSILDYSVLIDQEVMRIGDKLRFFPIAKSEIHRYKNYIPKRIECAD